MRLIDREVFYPAPDGETTAYASASYTRAQGADMMRVQFLERRDDTFTSWERLFSSDHGRTWSEPVPVSSERPLPGGGMHREYELGGALLHPTRDRLLVVVLAGDLATDMPLDGEATWYAAYRVSADGGRTWCVEDRIVQTGEEFDAAHPCEGVWIGRNSLHVCNRCMVASDGRMIVPVQISPLGEDGKLYNPTGAYTYHDAAVMIGTWRDDDHVDWELSSRVVADPATSTRGAIEPTVAEFDGGRMLMVLRGSNDWEGTLPGYRWHAVSEDGGRTWGPVAPWSYDDGEVFFSPSSISQLHRHSSGRTYWFGNICPENPRANGPRYPLLAGEVDPDSLRLIRDSIVEIDTLRAGEDPSLALSNFHVEQSRETGHWRVHCTRMFHVAEAFATGHSYLYRIEV